MNLVLIRPTIRCNQVTTGLVYTLYIQYGVENVTAHAEYFSFARMRVLRIRTCKETVHTVPMAMCPSNPKRLMTSDNKLHIHL